MYHSRRRTDFVLWPPVIVDRADDSLVVVVSSSYPVRVVPEDVVGDQDGYGDEAHREVDEADQDGLRGGARDGGARHGEGADAGEGHDGGREMRDESQGSGRTWEVAADEGLLRHTQRQS